MILTDHESEVARQALKRLAKHRNGSVLSLSDLGGLFKQDVEYENLRTALQKLKPQYVAIAPRLRSYRENMHLCMLRLLAGLDEDPQLDAFPGYLIASDPQELAKLVDRTIAFKPITENRIKPVSIGAIEDDDSRRYRSYQKAKVMQRMFADQGKESPAIIVTTRKSHTERKDFPELDAAGRNIAMLPTSARHTFSHLSQPATEALNGNNVLFMFGHGTPERIVGARAEAFAKIDFSDELVFCGSCMSASPYRADRIDLTAKQGHKRFAFHAIDNGAVMMLGHMGLCGGFPKVFPMAEHVLAGMSTGEAYQRLMNALIGDRQIPDYYPEPPPRKLNAETPPTTCSTFSGEIRRWCQSSADEVRSGSSDHTPSFEHLVHCAFHEDLRQRLRDLIEFLMGGLKLLQRPHFRFRIFRGQSSLNVGDGRFHRRTSVSGHVSTTFPQSALRRLQDRLRLQLRLDPTTSQKIVKCVFHRLLDHLLNVGVLHIHRRLQIHDLLAAGFDVTREHVQDSIGIDLKLDPDPRNGSGRLLKFNRKATEAPVVRRFLPLALQYVDEHLPLIVDGRGEHFSRLHRDGRVPRNDHVHQTAERLDAQ